MIDDKDPSYPNSDLDITDTIIDDGTTAIDGIDSFDPIADIKDEENSRDLEKQRKRLLSQQRQVLAVEFQYSMLQSHRQIILFTSCFLLKRQISPMTQSF